MNSIGLSPASAWREGLPSSKAGGSVSARAKKAICREFSSFEVGHERKGYCVTRPFCMDNSF
jgi:hypothetical protein